MKKKVVKNKYKNQDIVQVRIRRFLAMLIDWYLSNMLASIPVTFYLRGNDYIKPETFQLETYGPTTGLLLGLFVIILGIVYYFVIPTFVWKGQTLGKKICHVCVVKEDETEVDVKTMFIRELLGSTLIEGGIVVTSTYIRKMIQLFGFVGLVTPLKYIAYAITLLSMIYAYMNPLSQSFHDKIAKTIVVKI